MAQMAFFPIKGLLQVEIQQRINSLQVWEKVTTVTLNRRLSRKRKMSILRRLVMEESLTKTSKTSSKTKRQDRALLLRTSRFLQISTLLSWDKRMKNTVSFNQFQLLEESMVDPL